MTSLSFWVTAALVALTVCPTSVKAETKDRPNVIVIYTDDQGYGDASCLNPASKFSTPNIDRLANEGMIFTDGHCSDTVCTPSRYGLLTGRYAWRTRLQRGVMNAEGECLIEDGRMTLASLLRDNGYATGMVGKWHLGMDFPGTQGERDWSKPVKDMPLDKGFDYFWGIPASMNYGVLAWFEGRYAKTPPVQWTKKKPNKLALSDYRIRPPYATEKAPGLMETASDFVDSECLTRFTDKAIEWVELQAPNAREGKPFFLYLPYTSPHKPVIPIEKFRGKSEAGAYGDFMIETDWHVGRLLDALEEQGLTENTLILFTSDNGPENTWKQRTKLYEHASNGIYREGKRSIYEGGHRVPFIVRWPGVVAPKSRFDGPVCQTDMLATLNEILDKPLPDNAGEDSVSFLHVLKGSHTEKARPGLIHHGVNGRFAIRSGKWKLIMAHGTGAKMELYDVIADPSEKKNVIDAHSDVKKRLTAEITAIVENGRTTPGEPQKNFVPWWPDVSWIVPPM